MDEEIALESIVSDSNLVDEVVNSTDSGDDGDGGHPASAQPYDHNTSQWLKSSSMVATKHCMALVSTVLGFDIVELWSCCTTDSGDMDLQSLRCTYVHASKELIGVHPELITGNYPEQKKKHKVSPALVELAFKSTERYHWRVVRELTPDGKTQLHNDLWIPGKTEMAYMMKGSGTEEMDHLCVFIVAFSVDAVRLKPARLKFLDGIGTAIYVAAVYLDEDECKVEGADVELDIKEFNPQRPLMTDGHIDPELGFSREGLVRNGSVGMGVWGDSPPRSRSGSSALPLELQVPRGSPGGTIDDGSGSDASSKTSKLNQMERSDSAFNSQTLGGNSYNSSSSRMSLAIPEFSNRNSNQNVPVDITGDLIPLPPTWAPQYEFSYPVVNIPVAHQNIPDNLVLDRDFRSVMHLCNGSNSNIYRAILCSDMTDQWVIIKMIMEEAQHDPVAVHEFGECNFFILVGCNYSQ